MDNEQLKNLIALLEQYNRWKFSGLDLDIAYLISDIREMLKTN